jgi:hypothetical protein
MLFFARYRKRSVETTEILHEIINQMRTYRCMKGFIEKNRYESIMKTCRRLVEKGFYGDPFQIKRIISRISLIPHYGDTKEDRLVNTIQPMHKSHSLWFPHDWNDLQDMFAMYPAITHDDDLDAIEMLVSYSTAPKNKMAGLSNDVAVMPNNNKSSQSINQQRASRPYNVWTGMRHAVNQ